MQAEHSDSLKVLVFTEGGSGIGSGHIGRCLSLCQAFEEKGISPEIVIHGDNTISGLVTGKAVSVRDWLREESRLPSQPDNDVVVIDSYLADIRVYEAISKCARVPVYLDDNKRLDYPAGVIINGGINAEMLDYIKRRGSEYLLGTRYIPLRKVFWDLPEKVISRDIAGIMVTFGGDDMRDMTPGVLELLANEHPGVFKEVVIGRGFRNIERIKTVADKNTRLHYHPDAEAMRNIMLASDIAISAGGQTLYELAGVGVPAIAIAVADNQMNNIKGWQNAGYIEYAGWWEDGEVFNNIVNSLKTVQGQDVRTKLSQTGRSLVDGQGAKRVVDYLCRMLRDMSHV